MRYLLTLTCLLLATGVVADEGDFDFSSLGAKKALRDYKKALVEDKKAIELKRKKFDEEAESLAKTTRDAFVENLKKALKKSMQSGNLDEANKINAAIKAIKKKAVAPTREKTSKNKGDITDVNNLKKQLAGKRMAFVVPSGVREVILHSNGNILFPKGGSNINETKWSINQRGHVVFLHANGTASAIMAPINIGDRRLRFCGPYMYGSNMYHAIHEIQ